ncbi:hypothetical protein [Sphingobium algorifonticola]|nr:hypothetical protein [Sphingobium algorifonticola]
MADMSDSVPAVLLIDSRTSSDIAATVRAIRAVPGPSATLPIVLLTPHMDDAGQGCNAVLHLPLAAERMLDVVSEWAGPLEDAAFRSFDNPLYRLIRIVGRRRASAMLMRCLDSLRRALTQIAEGAPPKPIAHDTAGICGMLGFEALGVAWSAVEYDEPNALEDAVKLTRSTIARLSNN